MMPTVHAVIESAQALGVIEQLEVIQALSTSLQNTFTRLSGEIPPSPRADSNIPAWVHRAPPMTDMSIYVARFWPEDESADEVRIR